MKNKFFKIKLLKSLINLNKKNKLILFYLGLKKTNSIKIIKNSFIFIKIIKKFFLIII